MNQRDFDNDFTYVPFILQERGPMTINALLNCMWKDRRRLQWDGLSSAMTSVADMMRTRAIGTDVVTTEDDQVHMLTVKRET